MSREEEQEGKKEAPPQQDPEQPLDPQDEFVNEMCKEIQNSRKGDLCCWAFLSLIFFLILGILFAWKHEGGECKWLGFVSMFLFICCFIIVIMRIVELILIILPWKISMLYCTVSYHHCQKYFEIALYLTYVILATLFYLILQEPCEVLGPFVKWFLILSYIALIIWAVIDYNEKKKWEEENL